MEGQRGSEEGRSDTGGLERKRKKDRRNGCDTRKVRRKDRKQGETEEVQGKFGRREPEREVWRERQE